VESPVELPDSFAVQGEGAFPERWWEIFGDADLNAYMDQALGENFDLLIAWDRLAQARAIAEQKGAALYPEVNIAGAAARTRDEAGSMVNYYNQYNAGISVDYEADLWGRIRAAHMGAMLDVQSSEEDAAATAIVLSAKMARTWYVLAEFRGQVDIIRRQIETNEKVLSLITVQFRKNKIGAADVLRQRQLVEASRGQLILVKEQIELLEHELAILAGAAPGKITLPEESRLANLPVLAMLPIPSELIQRRPDVRSAYLGVQAADQRVAAAIADQFPRIGLAASAETYGLEARDLFDNWVATLAGNLMQPLFDGNQRRAEVERNRALLSQAIHTYGKSILTSLQEVEDALTQERRQAEYLSNLEIQLDLAQKVAERTRENYIKGQLDYLRVLEALVSLQSLERNCLNAKQQLISDRIDLCKAIAGGWAMKVPEQAVLRKPTERNHPETEPR